MPTIDKAKQIILKMHRLLFDFLKQEKQIKAESKKRVLAAIKEGEQKKIEETKKQINQI